MTTFEVLIIFAAVAVLAVLYFLFFYDDSPLKKTRGKNIDDARKTAPVLSVLNSCARSRGGKVLTDVHVAKNGRFADADAVLIGYYGVTAVRCIGLGGEIYGTAQDEQWLQVLNDKTRGNIPNPMLGMDENARLLRDTLFDAKLKNVPVEMVAVFTNKKAQIAVGRNAGYYTVKTFKKLMQTGKYLQDKNVDINATAAAILKWQVGAEK